MSVRSWMDAESDSIFSGEEKAARTSTAVVKMNMAERSDIVRVMLEIDDAKKASVLKEMDKRGGVRKEEMLD